MVRHSRLNDVRGRGGTRRGSLTSHRGVENKSGQKICSENTAAAAAAAAAATSGAANRVCRTLVLAFAFVYVRLHARTYAPVCVR